ncbi:hypothetical protein Oweho_2835 [Owenweeksia hongkongensis DSM 17368]|uniref:Uncharacterized protein n=1 Tax=Owenweeksia hongkongensis (strain DSM 17368 / CIP 108786 / JCM 12287 / NRRL B-23963 / UST20020801) TaxID=926562 RepID=G8R0R8_OWEHD|nr:hypothetical protein Oweho_2835 [Owenweeksia hongkongensis DSM 17368]
MLNSKQIKKVEIQKFKKDQWLENTVRIANLFLAYFLNFPV